MLVKNRIKSLLALENIKVKDLAVLLKEKYNKDILPNTLSKQINNVNKKNRNLSKNKSHLCKQEKSVK